MTFSHIMYVAIPDPDKPNWSLQLKLSFKFLVLCAQHALGSFIHWLQIWHPSLKTRKPNGQWHGKTQITHNGNRIIKWWLWLAWKDTDNTQRQQNNQVMTVATSLETGRKRRRICSKQHLNKKLFQREEKIPQRTSEHIFVVICAN